LAFVPYDFAKGILNGRIITFDKVAINELHSERALAWSPYRQQVSQKIYLTWPADRRTTRIPKLPTQSSMGTQGHFGGARKFFIFQEDMDGM